MSYIFKNRKGKIVTDLVFFCAQVFDIVIGKKDIFAAEH